MDRLGVALGRSARSRASTSGTICKQWIVIASPIKWVIGGKTTVPAGNRLEKLKDCRLQPAACHRSPASS